MNDKQWMIDRLMLKLKDRDTTIAELQSQLRQKELELGYTKSSLQFYIDNTSKSKSSNLTKDYLRSSK